MTTVSMTTVSMTTVSITPVSISLPGPLHPQQWGRMRCVVDRYYAAWQTNPTPSTIVLAPTLAHFSYANNRTANMTWTAPLYPGQASLSGYVLERSPPFPGGATITLSGAATRYLDVGMADGNYRYRVWAVNGLGRATYPSPWSATVAVVPPEGFSFTLPVIICLSVVGGCVLLSVVFGIFLCRARRKSHQSHLAAVVLTPVSTADGAPSAAVTMSEPLIAAEDK
ncbi:hypothetical protein PAPYR_4 [Paratrimastix pyriformis]|uniref:Fibronectin type-III domain-containing protein n=1 Tax=Paratrimastix pyriformis TaxID=342808 RepID=A0ABQ8UWH0_9EUKA|nr:hypothetical protein PAPYR_4 [Paratrimastix pyriformis]